MLDLVASWEWRRRHVGGVHKVGSDDGGIGGVLVLAHDGGELVHEHLDHQLLCLVRRGDHIESAREVVNDLLAVLA